MHKGAEKILHIRIYDIKKKVHKNVLHKLMITLFFAYMYEYVHAEIYKCRPYVYCLNHREISLIELYKA